MTARWIALLCLLLSTPAFGWEEVAAVDSAVVSTRLRTLRGCPRKHVIGDAASYARVVDGLPGAPGSIDFAAHAVLLLVTDDVGGSNNRVVGLEGDGAGTLRLILERDQPELYQQRGEPELTCHLFVVARPVEGLRLEIRTSLGESGFVQRPVPPSPADLNPDFFPQLGPDLRLSWTIPGAQPAEGEGPDRGQGVRLRLETTFPDRPQLPARANTYYFDSQRGTLGIRFPRIRDDVRHLYAAHAPGWRSINPLVLRELPAGDGSGSPAPVVHRFELEPVPGRDE